MRDLPIDAETLRYLEFTGRTPKQIELVEAYARAQGLWHDAHTEEQTYTETLEPTSTRSSRRSRAKSARRIACR